jgi:hypothetical protein
VTELTQVLQSGERDRARKEFVDATRAKVLSAAQRHVEEKKKKVDHKQRNSVSVAGPSAGAAAAVAAASADTASGSSSARRASTADATSAAAAAAAAATASEASGGAARGGDARGSEGSVNAVAASALAQAKGGTSIGVGGLSASLGEITEAIDELTRRRRALVQAGFDEEAGEAARALARLREMAEAKRRESLQKLYKQKLWALQLQQKHEAHRLHREQEGRKAAADQKWKEEVEALKGKQAADYQQNVEIITKAAALEDVELPRRLVKYRYRASPQLQALRETIANLQETGGLREMIEAVQIKADAMEQSEVSAWRENFLRVALGSDSSSYISQLLANQQARMHATPCTPPHARHRTAACPPPLTLPSPHTALHAPPLTAAHRRPPPPPAAHRPMVAR